jgi:hypothetical protein
MTEKSPVMHESANFEFIATEPLEKMTRKKENEQMSKKWE